jgi:hypothetical protein
MGYGFLDPVPGVLIFVALAAWSLGAIGLARQLVRKFVAVSCATRDPGSVESERRASRFICHGPLQENPIRPEPFALR